MKKQNQTADNQTPEAEEKSTKIMSGDKVPATMLEPYYHTCLELVLFASREALGKVDRQAWHNGGNPHLFATFLIANELARILNDAEELEDIAERFCFWWSDVSGNRVQMRRVFTLLPQELVNAIDKLCERVPSYYPMTRETVPGFLLARATWSEH